MENFYKILISKLKNEGLKIEKDPIVEEIDEMINNIKYINMFDIEIKRIDRNKKLVFKMGTNSQMMLSIYYFFNGQWIKNNNDFLINTNEFWELYEKIVIALK